MFNKKASLNLKKGPSLCQYTVVGEVRIKGTRNEILGQKNFFINLFKINFALLALKCGINHYCIIRGSIFY